jgi:hypothetical protein
MSGLEIFAITIIAASIPTAITLLSVLCGNGNKQLSYLVALIFISIFFVITVLAWAMGEPFMIGGGA